MRLAFLAAVSILFASGCDDVTSLTLRLEYNEAECNGNAAADQTFSEAGTVAVHVLDGDSDRNGVLQRHCFNIPVGENRTLLELARVLDENLDLAPVPFESTILLQVSVYNRLITNDCAPFDMSSELDQAIPKFFGRNEIGVRITKESSVIPLLIRCL